MKITFYGVRGSIPVCDSNFMKFGGNTSCALVEDCDGATAILDAGTGIRRLGAEIVKGRPMNDRQVYILLSHTHWDHIQGFPFFAPAYVTDFTITLIICGMDQSCSDLHDIIETQSRRDYFPVPLDRMAANIRFYQPDLPGLVGGLGNKIDFYKHRHPGGAYTYRFTEVSTGKVLVYSTDIEHGDQLDEDHIRFCENADLLIHDGQYTADELPAKKGWGHSSWEQAVEVAERANVKKLAVTHHDPEHDDNFLSEIERACQKRFSASFLTREGMTVEL